MQRCIPADNVFPARYSLSQREGVRLSEIVFPCVYISDFGVVKVCVRVILHIDYWDIAFTVSVVNSAKNGAEEGKHASVITSADDVWDSV